MDESGISTHTLGQSNARSESAPSLRVACFPGFGDDDLYQKLFYDALGETGGDLVGVLTPDDRWLQDNVGRIDAIHFHWPESLWRDRGNSWLGKLRGVVGLTRYLRLAAKLGIKRIWTMHNLDHHEGSNWVDRLGYRQLAKNSDLIICHSQHAKKALQKRDRPRAPIVVMNHGSYDGVYPSPRPQGEVLRSLGLDPDKPVVCCVGLLRPYKGFDTALRAVVELDGEVQLIVAGEPGESFDSSIFDEVDVEQGVVKIFRRISDQEFSDIVNASEAVLLPYRQITGSGALLAAWTLKRGVIVSDLQYFREIASPEPDAVAYAHGVRFESAVD